MIYPIEHIKNWWTMMLPHKLCRWFGHKSDSAWDIIPDRMLQNQFDPSGVHFLHSHYRPTAIFPSIKVSHPDYDLPLSCTCKRCGALIWEFDSKSLDGRVWGKPDEYEDRVNAIQFEHDFMGIPTWRA